MKILKTYSFKHGKEFLQDNHPEELAEVIEAINCLDASKCLTKVSDEKTKVGKLLFSPTDLNNHLKLSLHKLNWTAKSNNKKKVYAEPRHNFGNGRFREMDGLKNKVGLEIQFGKYAFMGYDIFSKMVIFKNLGRIECGIEVVATSEFVRFMSTGVSSFEQLLIDFEYRGESDIDIPVYVIGIGLTDEEKEITTKMHELFKENPKKAKSLYKLRKYKGSKPGPK